MRETLKWEKDLQTMSRKDFAGDRKREYSKVR